MDKTEPSPQPLSEMTITPATSSTRIYLTPSSWNLHRMQVSNTSSKPCQSGDETDKAASEYLLVWRPNPPSLPPKLDCFPTSAAFDFEAQNVVVKPAFSILYRENPQ